MDGPAANLKSSRLSTLNVFGKFSSSSKPPPPPPKDAWYSQARGSRSVLSLAPSHSASTANLSLADCDTDTLRIPTSPGFTSRSQYDLSLRSTSPVPSTSTTQLSEFGGMSFKSGVRTGTGGSGSSSSSLRKGFSKISTSLGIGRRPKLFSRSNSSKVTLQTVDPDASFGFSEDGVLVDTPDGDDAISRPYNVQHDIHVDEGLGGLPPEWVNKLRASGFTEAEILATQKRPKRTTYLLNHPDLSPDTIRSPIPPVPPLPLSLNTNKLASSPSHSPISPASLAILPNVPVRSTSLRRPTALNEDAISISTTIRSIITRSDSPASAGPHSLKHSYVHGNGSRVLTSPSSSPAPSRSESLLSNPHSPSSRTNVSIATGARSVTEVTNFNSNTSVVRSNSSYTTVDDDEAYGPPEPPRTPPPQQRQTIFRVTNMSPPQPGSPPPAYGAADHARGKAQGLGNGDSKTEMGSRAQETRQDRIQQTEERTDGDSEADNARNNLTNDVDHRERSDSDLAPSSEETVTLRRMNSDALQRRAYGEEEDEDDRPLGLTANRVALTNSDTNSTEIGQPRLATPPASSPIRLHLSTPSRSENDITDFIEASSPPPSPLPRPPPKAPRLSLHVDMDNDLSSWTRSLFSALDSSEPLKLSLTSGSKDVDSPLANVVTSTSSSRRDPVRISRTPRKSSIRSLALSASSPARSISSEIDQSMDGNSPLFDEVMSLVQSQSPVHDEKEKENDYEIDASALLVPTRPSSTYLSNNTSPPPLPQLNYEFLKYKPNRSSSISQPSSRDSQATISGSSRWSKATVTTMRDATIARATKPAMVSAAAVPAPMPSRHGQNSSINTVDDVSADVSVDVTGSSVDSSSILDASALEFPMPPPSPLEGSFKPSPSPTSPRFPPSSPVDSVRASTAGADAPLGIGRMPSASTSTNRLPSPSSSRSSQSSSSVSSTYSSHANPLSITSCSESSNEGADEEDDTISRLANAVRVELRCTDSEGYLSPTDSEAGSRKWTKEQEKHISMRRSVYSNSNDDGLYDEPDDNAPPVVDWLTNSPHSPHYEKHGNVKRDSTTVYNHLQRNSSLQQGILNGSSQVKRPSIQINGTAALEVQRKSQKPLSPSVSPSPVSSDPSPMDRYRGWVSEVLSPLEDYISHDVDPRQLFSDMQEIAEGESGSVFVARVIARSSATKKTLVEPVEDGEFVAIKNVPLLPGGSSKLLDLQKELVIMSRIRHENILSMEALYVDLVEDCLWIEMELMERSLADMLALAAEGLMLLEPVIARFSKDVLEALAHLEDLGIAHRDVRSDNLLVNSQGVLKIADFSSALLINPATPVSTEVAGVWYWQAPEMRKGLYDARKVDVWSLGATAWEMAESEPPFINVDIKQIPDKWPELSQPEIYSRSFHDFLSLCSNPPSARPSAHDLLMTPFIRNACKRSEIANLLSQCKDIEERIHRRQSVDSEGTISS